MLFTAPMVSGCFGGSIISSDSEGKEHWLPDVEDREKLYYENTDVFSRVSRNGSYGIDEVRSIYVSVPAITASVSYTHLRAHET